MGCICWPTAQPATHLRPKQDVIDACLASGHLPFLLDGRLAATMRGEGRGVVRNEYCNSLLACVGVRAWASLDVLHQHPGVDPAWVRGWRSACPCWHATAPATPDCRCLAGTLCAAGMRAVDGAFCRWAAMLRQRPGELLSSLLRPTSTAAALSGSGAPAQQQQAALWARSTAAAGATAFPAAPAFPAGQAGAASGGPLGAVPRFERSRFVLDYINDDQLGPLRTRFAAVRVRPAEGLHELVRYGAAYAQRLHAHGVWAAWLRSNGSASPLAA